MLKIPIPQAVGHLFLLWWWALDYAENGDLSKYDAYDIADAVQWDGNPEEFLDAMIECGPGGTCGFVEKDGDGNIFIHDWDKYSGRLVEKREKNRIRKAEERKNKSAKISAKKTKKSSKNGEENPESDKPSSVAGTEKIDDEKSVRDVSRATGESVAEASQGYITQHNTTEQNMTQQDTTAPPPPVPVQEKKSAAAEAEKEKIKLGEIVSLWNTKLAPLGFPRILKQTKPREEALKALLNSSPDRNKFLWWQEIFDKISRSEFLRKSILERSWFTLDWLLNEHNLVKLLEGRYDNRPAQKSKNQAQDARKASSIEEIMARHRAKNSNAIDAEYSVVGEGEKLDGERPPGFR